MFMNGVATVTAGGTAEVEATWMLPLPLATFAGASARWEVLDRQGSVWSFGDATSITIETAPIGTDTHVRATATINIPVDAPADPAGTSYQVRWILAYGGGQQYAFDAFTVFPRVADTTGPADAVILAGHASELHLTLETEHAGVLCMIYYQNTPITEVTATKQAVAEGWRYTVPVAADYKPGPSLYPYTCIWRYGPPGKQVMQQASMWLINPTIMQAQTEIRNFLLKSYADSSIDPDQEFTPATLLQHLQQGAEFFNACGYPTNFTMTRASGPIRAFWLKYATIAACRSQYMHEGMKAFNYGGQVVNLDVDRSQYWESMATSLQSEVDQAVKPFKENLVRRGLLGGDGNVDANALRFGAVGAIGVSLTPVSPIRGASGYIGIQRRR